MGVYIHPKLSQQENKHKENSCCIKPGKELARRCIDRWAGGGVIGGEETKNTGKYTKDANTEGNKIHYTKNRRGIDTGHAERRCCLVRSRGCAPGRQHWAQALGVEATSLYMMIYISISGVYTPEFSLIGTKILF